MLLLDNHHVVLSVGAAIFSRIKHAEEVDALLPENIAEGTHITYALLENLKASLTIFWKFACTNKRVRKILLCDESYYPILKTQIRHIKKSWIIQLQTFYYTRYQKYNNYFVNRVEKGITFSRKWCDLPFHFSLDPRSALNNPTGHINYDAMYHDLKVEFTFRSAEDLKIINL